MRNHFRLSVLFRSLAALGLTGCSLLTGSGEGGVAVDPFDSGSLARYTIHNTPEAWSVSGGYLRSGTEAAQSVVIRRGAVIEDGWVETETDSVTDGGLVLRFRGKGDYYLLAIRDDSRFGYANLEIYRASDGEFERLDFPVDIDFPRGARKTVRFQANGNVLSAYLDGVLMQQVTDDTYSTGGFGLRHDNTRELPGTTSRFDLLRWTRD
ncbi:MAG TPA: hypothetical protein VEQ60_11045 [Longimicrobium sp.]|nr:hypothetical protein [Longimicrobium sp.]